MLFIVIFALLILWGILCLIGGVLADLATVDDIIQALFWGAVFIAVGLIWPITVGMELRTGDPDAPLIFLGDWIRGCMHLQAQAWEWLKEATGF